MAKIQTIVKKRTEKIKLWKEIGRGTIAISKVVAALLGTINNGPTQTRTTVLMITDGTFPITPVIPLIFPVPRIIATTVTKAKPTSVKKKHKKPKNQSFPDVIPKYGGKIKLPAPKNIAKTANPMTIKSYLRFAGKW